MSFRTRTTQELVQIAAAGGGLRLTAATRRTDELVQIAAAARGHGATIIFEGLSSRTTQELVQIAAAGGGRVIFED